MTVKAILAGSFDPFTLGHLDLVHRSMKLCDQLVIAIGVNAAKACMFSEEERLKQINNVVSQEMDFLVSTNITVASFHGLLVDYAKEIEATVLIRGIRSFSDFEYETTLANINKNLAPNIETVFLSTRPELAIISSSMVKELVRYKQDVSALVPKQIAKLISKISQP